MTNRKIHPFSWRVLSIGSFMAVGLTLSACATGLSNQHEDQSACNRMGARQGSRAYTDCMLQQQHRRDQKMSVFLQQQLMHQELGRPAREKLEEKKARRAREKRRNERRNESHDYR